MKSPFRIHGAIAPAPYLWASFALLLVQYGTRCLVFKYHIPNTFAFWSLLQPASVVEFVSWLESGGHSNLWLLALALVTDIVMTWFLLSLAIRRARTADLSALVANLAIVPVIQVPIICWLGWSATREGAEVPAVSNRVSFEAALKGLVAGLIVTVVLEVLCTIVFRTYGFGLFLASPFIVGCVTAYIGNRRSDLGPWGTTKLVFGACFLGCVGLLAIAVEGIICLLMATPLIAGMAWLGGMVGRAIALKRPGATPGRTAMSIVVLPLFFTVDLVAPPHFAFDSVESIEVAASDMEVWDAVVHMGPIPDPPAAPFRWGLAYPISGSIRGSGVGAIRQGVFSTGVAYERVTEWEPAKYLSFIVLSDPPTMHELSPYRHVNAPHVNGYFRTLDARFTITKLASGHTLLSLATRHELDLNPAVYWLPMAEWAVHTNKARVLAHFAQQAEAAAEAKRQSSIAS
jgi:hypothetical protein